MRLKNYLKENYGNPKAGDKILYNGKKLTITNVGSGLGFDKYITVRFDGEKNERDIKMIDFFKPQNKVKVLKEENLLSHISPPMISHQILKPGDRSKINRDLQKILKQTYFESIPLDQMFKVLDKHGIVPLQEDNTKWSGILTGGVKKTEMVNINLGWKKIPEKDIKKRGYEGEKITYPNPKGQYFAVPNAVLVMTYYKMASGKYEVIGYVS